MARAAIMGASGYVGGELLRILATHEHVEVALATSRRYAGKPIHYVHFNLRGHYTGLRFTNHDVNAVLRKDVDVAFLALPHGTSVDVVPELLNAGLTVVDLSADYRLKDPEKYVEWYGYEHPHPDLLQKAVYGMPELHREELRGAKLIASPGCNATAAIIALIPLIKEGLVRTDQIIIDVKAGSSEAGATPSLPDHHPEREGSVRPYMPAGHRHVAEVEQELSIISGKPVRASLTPHAVSMVRGSLATAYCIPAREVSARELMRVYTLTYGKELFVRIVKTSPHRYPNPKYVIGSNYADVSFEIESRAGIVKAFAAIDNLVKGAAGQAVQSLNVALGFPEDSGLRAPPLRPA